MIRGLDSILDSTPPRTLGSRVLQSLVLLLWLGAFVGQLHAQDQPTISVDEVRRGQTGYGVRIEGR